MTPPFDTWLPKRRRTFLRVIGAATSAGALKDILDVGAAELDTSVVMEQGDRCVELAPLSGDEPVEELYDYTYPMDRFDGPPGSQGPTYSSEGTTDLQRDRTSILFLYDGPEGMSLVVVHGHLDGDRDAGGTVTFTVEGLPEAATWVVRDDYYLEDGEVAGSNFDRWDVDGDVHVVDWAYQDGRTDGGAVRGLGSDFEVTIEPAFDDDAALATDHDFGPIEAWEVVAGDRDAPDRFPLRLERPVTIRTGTCGEPTDDRESTGDEKSTGDGEATEDEEATEDDERGEKDERRQRKHGRKQRKHGEKHQKEKRKHRKRQRKHREKHRKRQRKHREKHRKKQRKHRKHSD